MTWKALLAKSLSEFQYNHVLYYYIHVTNGIIPRRLNLTRPQTFNEKTIWLKMHHRIPSAEILVDKVRVKQHVADLIGAECLIPTIGVWEDPETIQFSALPDSFVLKANHGSGWNIICRRKSDCEEGKIKQRLKSWISTNYYDIGKEYQYRNIPPRVLCEPYLGGDGDESLTDYKVFCFGGEPYCIQVDLDRFTNHTRAFYDIGWNAIPFTTLYPKSARVVPRPESLEEMLRIARRLSRELVFARIDLYYHRKRVYFGEITLHHGGGFEPFLPREYDRVLGTLIELPGSRVQRL